MSEIYATISQVITPILTVYLIFYSQRKGTNQADKQDLKELTKIVEEVKKDSLKEIELLKSSLSLLQSKRSSLFMDEKESIVTFFSKLNAWVWDIVSIYLSEYNHVNYEEISTRLATMRENYHQINITFSKVRLLVKDENLINIGHASIVKVLAFHHEKERLMAQLKSNLVMEKIMVDQFIKNAGKVPKELEEFKIFSATTNEEERKKIVSDSLLKQNENWKPTIDTVLEFKTYAKEYLNS